MARGRAGSRFQGWQPFLPRTQASQSQAPGLPLRGAGVTMVPCKASGTQLLGDVQLSLTSTSRQTLTPVEKQNRDKLQFSSPRD